MIVAFSVTPLGVGEDVGEYVADAVRVVRESGLPNRTDAMFTSVEGEWDEVMDVVRRAVAAVEAPGAAGLPGPQGGHPPRRDGRPHVEGRDGRAPPRRMNAPARAVAPSGIERRDGADRHMTGR
ncbi:uncharacterized protein (TIGR00106 family) [Streptomyces ambofaciens]